MFGDAPQIQKIRHPNITNIKPVGLIERCLFSINVVMIHIFFHKLGSLTEPPAIFWDHMYEI